MHVLRFLALSGLCRVRSLGVFPKTNLTYDYVILMATLDTRLDAHAAKPYVSKVLNF